MNADEFGRLKGVLVKLTPNQRRQIKDQIHAAEQQQAVHGVLESRVAGNPMCPHCGAGPLARWGPSMPADSANLLFSA
jgi:hypothetical protein